MTLQRTLAAGLLMTASATALAGDAAAGRLKAQACAVCHGQLGQSTLPDTPSLAGQPEIYLAAQLRAYRAGTRRHEVMAVIAKPLSDTEIGDLSSWFASIVVEVRPPR
jgi:cytochrome c553